MSQTKPKPTTPKPTRPKLQPHSTSSASYTLFPSPGLTRPGNSPHLGSTRPQPTKPLPRLPSKYDAENRLLLDAFPLPAGSSSWARPPVSRERLMAPLPALPLPKTDEQGERREAKKTRTKAGCICL